MIVLHSDMYVCMYDMYVCMVCIVVIYDSDI